MCLLDENKIDTTFMFVQENMQLQPGAIWLSLA